MNVWVQHYDCDDLWERLQRVKYAPKFLVEKVTKRATLSELIENALGDIPADVQQISVRKLWTLRREFAMFAQKTRKRTLVAVLDAETTYWERSGRALVREQLFEPA